MKITKTPINGLYTVENKTFSDERGFFREAVRFDELNKVIGFEFKPVQINHSLSKPNVIRALHAENWNKLVYPVSGKMFSVVVDVRPESNTFGKYERIEFTGDRKALFIPKGLANSICVNNSEAVNYVYFVDAYYDGTDTQAIAWDDPDLGIDWEIKNPIISNRDRNNPRLRELFPKKFI